MDRPRQLYLFCYDIAHNKRRYRLARALEGLGLRVQESVFECWLDADDARRAGRELMKLINPAEDLLHWYRLTHEEARATQVLGSGSRPQEPGNHYV